MKATDRNKLNSTERIAVTTVARSFVFNSTADFSGLADLLKTPETQHNLTTDAGSNPQKLARVWAHQAQHSTAAWLIETVDSSQIVGAVQLFNSYVSIVVNEEFRRRGVAFATLSQLLHVSEIYGIKVIKAQIFRSNLPAIATFEKLGFTFDGLYHDNRNAILNYVRIVHP